MKKTLLFLLWGLVLVPSVYSQNSGATVSELWGKSPSYVENIIPPSPNVAQAVRYADYPVSYCLGTTDVSIPLYTVKCRELSLPLGLSCHTGGIKVDEVAGVAGLGWNLDAGGVITREIVYMPDEYQSEYGMPGDFFKMMSPLEIRRRLNENLEDPTVLEYFRAVTQNRNDAGYDRYRYNFCGHSGSFVIDRTKSDRIGQVVVNNFRIIPAADRNSFTITTDDGAEYYFSVREQVAKRHVESQSAVSDYYAPDAWYLSRIVSFNKTDTIRLEYAQAPTWKKVVSSTVMTMSGTVGADNYVELEPPVQTVNSVEYKYKPHILTGIRFRGGSVAFAYDDEGEKVNHRPDLAGENLRDEVFNYPKKLRSIVVRNNSGDIIRRAEFTMGRFGNDKRICLSALKVYSGTVLDESYKFTYNNPTASVNRFSQDFFGYFNGEPNPSLNPIRSYADFFSDTFPGRRYSFAHARTFSLAQIDRNGARTVFEYEPSRYTDASRGDVSIGLRIKSIGTYNGNTLVRRRELDYDDAQCTIDFSAVDKSFYISRGADSYLVNATDLRYKVSVSVYEHSVAPGAAPENARICYGRVSETVSDGTASNTVKTEYIYDCDPDKNRYVATGGKLDTCILHEKFSQTNFASNDGRYSGYAGEIRGYFKERPQFFNNLTEKNIYKTNSAGQYELVSRTVNKYRRSVSSDVLTDFFIRHLGEGGTSAEPGLHPGGGDTTNPDDDGGFIIPIKPVDPQQNAKHANNFYFFHVYSDAANSSRVYDSRQTDYLPSGEALTRDKFEYTRQTTYDVWPAPESRESAGDIFDGEIELANGSESFQSGQMHRHSVVCDGTIYRYNYLYPETYALLAPYDRMIARNNLTAPVGTELVKRENAFTVHPDNIYRKGRYTGYDTFVVGGDSLVMPRLVVERLGNETVRQQEMLRYGEKGNVLEMREDGLSPVCYLWGYEYAYPVAEIRNADYDDVIRAVGGAEAVGQIARSAQLGDEQYALLLSLRHCLPGASVRIFRYIPLVGVCEAVDPSGRVTHYKYDDAWRLRLVCDDEGEPVESYEYFKNANNL